ncbi:hypothetical protein H3V53_12180 [Paraburkholderia bengalensis]|uniref:Uncharacterized protein n=1 Tax=Paraburkholderia bengalensis TaxID=2747562 RepID=A0ABU8IR06_9BURK
MDSMRVLTIARRDVDVETGASRWASIRNATARQRGRALAAFKALILMDDSRPR